MKMNKILFASILTIAGTFAANARLSVADGKMNFSTDLRLADMHLRSNQSATVTPAIITADGDTLYLSPVSVYGRRSMIHMQRTNSEPEWRAYSAGNVPDSIAYSESVAFTPALNGARSAVRTEVFGCANCLKSTSWVNIDDPWQMPTVNPANYLHYETPAATAVKETALQGKAFVEFPVNSIKLLPDFRTNSSELAKIVSVIDSVKSDPDMTITSIAIKGYASPEGSWANNERLAKGRTQALKTYVEQLYSFPSDFIATSWEAEDWTGLRQAVEADETIADRTAILAVIDNTALEPDARDYKLRTEFPQTYRMLLADIYPALRHSDYRVAYTIRSFSTPAEILKVMSENPAKLSPDEFYLAAESLNPTSAEFRNVWETACRIHPSNETARINAANAAIAAGDASAAAAHLALAGNSDAANYARALLAIERHEWKSAANLLSALNSYAKAPELLKKVNDIISLQ